MLDLNLLRLLKHRKEFFELYPIIPKDKPLDQLTIQMIGNFRKYYDAYPTHQKIDLNEFGSRFRVWYPKLTDDRMNAFQAVIRQLAHEPDEDTRNGIVGSLAELNLFTEVANLAMQHNEGDLEEGVFKLVQSLDAYKKRAGYKEFQYIDIPIEELLLEEFDDSGVKWRLGCLAGGMRGLRPGDFGIIAGRPDKGKTSFLASELTFFAPQLPEKRNILWLNNEGPGKRIIPRLYQAALGLTMEQMKLASNANTLVPAYKKAIGGRLDKFRIADIHGFHVGAVEQIIENSNAGIIVYDMIDNIKGFGSEARTDLALEEMYKWAREISVKYDCVGLATSQISNDGDGLQYPTLGMLKDSKTGKQGACDFQLMIGAANDPIFARSRFISLPKNKLRRPGGDECRTEVRFDADRCRYEDMEMA